MSSSFLNSSPRPSFPLILSSPISPSSSSRLPYKSLPFSLSKTLSSFSLSSSSSFLPLSLEEEDHVIGDCIVFEEDAFEDPFPLQTEPPPNRKPKKPPPVKPEDLIPAEWKEAQAEINMSKKDKKMIAQQLQFGSRIERIKKVRTPDMVEYASYRDMKSRQLKPVVLDSPIKLPEEIEMGGPRFSENEAEMGCSSSGRVMPRNPRLAVAESSLEDIKELFDSDAYKPGENSEKNSEGRRKLFTKEEKVLLNKRIPNVAAATSNKWLPLHTLAASGEFYLVDKLLKNNVDVNAVDKDGLTALHKAILCKKQAITNYLLRESANPFVRDKEGATLMHYAIRAASSQTVKILLLYNVDINLPDEDGWTPLHLAVQTQRTDLVRLLLIKGADKTLKNREGLTPLDLCLYLGRDVRTYELIKLLKELPKSNYTQLYPLRLLVEGYLSQLYQQK